MSEFKGTPGQWEVCFDHPDEDTRQSLAFIRPRGHGYGETEIASIYCCGGDAEREANARLIAAAPCLLEALDYALLHLWPNTEAANKARAAIAKATGSQSCAES